MTLRKSHLHTDSLTPHIFNYSENRELCSSNRLQTPECSAVKSNANGENLLAGSELSLLQKIAQVNNKVFNSAVFNQKSEQEPLRPLNQMKFSFNKNNAFPISNEQNNSEDVGNKSSTLKDIYYKQFEKQSQKIKTVQEERKQIINTICSKIDTISDKTTRKNTNKENLAGSIKRKNFVDEKRKMNNAYSKSTLHSQALTEHKQYEPHILKKAESKDEQSLSLKYLQDSLAKTREQKVQITKVGYLQQSSNRKQGQNKELQKFILVRQFEAREEQFVDYLQSLFQQLDVNNTGRLDQFNCEYVRIKQEFKIAFGYILIRIKFKDLVLDKSQFVKLGLQTIKELNSEQFIHLLKHVKAIRQKSIQTDYSSFIPSNINPNFQKNSAFDGRTDQKQKYKDIDQQRAQTKGLKQNKKERQSKSNEGKIQLSRRQKSLKKLSYKNPQYKLKEGSVHSRDKQKKKVKYQQFEIETALQEIRRNTKNQKIAQLQNNYENKYQKSNKHSSYQSYQNYKTQKSKRQQGQQSKRQQGQQSKRQQGQQSKTQSTSFQKYKSKSPAKRTQPHLITFNEELDVPQRIQPHHIVQLDSPQKTKKKRNISEQMILEQKRNLSKIEELHSKIEKTACINRKVLQQMNRQNSHLRMSEWLLDYAPVSAIEGLNWATIK